MAEQGHHEQDVEQQGVDPGWQHCTLVDSKQRRVKCNWCGKEMGGGVYRLKNHIAGIAGDVSRCESVPLHLKKEMRTYMMGKKAQKDLSSQQHMDLQDEISGRQRRRDYSLPVQRPIDLHDDEEEEEEEEDPDDPDPEYTRAVRASMQTNIQDEDRRRGIGSSAGSGPTGSQPGRFVPRGSSGRRTASSVLGCGRTSDVARGPMDQFLYRSRSARQPGIKQALKGVKASAKNALKGIVKWFVHAGVPAHTASSPYFQTMVDAIADAGPGLKAPTARYIYDVGLEEEYNDLKLWVDNFKNVWKERGCTIMCDGWTGTTRRSMINFLVYCSEGTIFLKSVDASNKIKNAEYLYRLMDEVVEEIGEENIVQIVTDNEASYKAAGKLLMQKRKHLYWVPCAAHSLDLMMEDIGKDQFVSEVVEQAQMITGFIYSHNRILHMMREHTGGRDLLRAGPTRFASNFISLESLSKYKHQLAQLVHSDQFLTHIRTLRADARDVAFEVQSLVGDKSFWDKVSRYLKVVEPLVHVLRLVDGDEKNDMGYLYEAMDRANEHLKKSFPSAHEKWWRIIDARWESTLHHDLHAAGYFFNPRYQYSESVHNDGEVLRGTTNVITRISRTTNERIDALAEMERFKLKIGIYGDEDVRAAVWRTTPAEWWIQINYRQAATNPLAYVAVRVLSQTTSSSQCERNWSTFSLIHTKIRNRLGVSRLEKLVYCHYNMRLRIRQIQERQRLERQRFMEFAGRPVDEVVHQIDIDELLDEEHPLHSWVESRTARDAQPEFDPQDRSWAEGELDTVVARDPEFQGTQEGGALVLQRRRKSATLPDTARPAASQPALRRSATQVDPRRRKEKEPAAPSLHSASSKRKKQSKGKSKQQVDPSEEEQARVQQTFETPEDTPGLPSHLASMYEAERQTYRRRKRRSKKTSQVRSDDSTEDDDDDDGDGDGDGAAAAAGLSGGSALGSSYTGYDDYSAPPSHSGGTEGQRQGQQGGFEGQQRHAAYDWPPWEQASSYPPIFQPPTLAYSDISSTTEGYSGPPPIQYGIYVPPAQSGESSSQQAYTPRGIQRGFEDLASSLFGYGYPAHMSADYGPPAQTYDPDDEGSQM